MSCPPSQTGSHRAEVVTAPGSAQEKPPFSFFKLTRMGLLPCTRTESDQLHRLGYDDAVRWAQANGRGSLCREGSRPGASFP